MRLALSELRPAFRRAPVGSSRGIGGEATEFVETCELYFRHLDGNWDHILPLRLAVPTAVNATYPSILGRDVLRYYRLTFQELAGIVQMEGPDELR